MPPQNSNMTNIHASEQIEIIKSSAQTICRFFWGSDPKSCQEMLTGSLLAPLRKYGKSSTDKVAEKIDNLITGLKSYKSAKMLNDDLETDYVHFFINDREGILTPLYDSCYGVDHHSREGQLMGKPEREMRERFSEVGLAMANSVNEPADHISLELEYLFFLLDRGLQMEDPDLISEAALFSRDFMLPWIKEMSVRFKDEEQATFYPQLVTTLKLNTGG